MCISSAPAEFTGTKGYIGEVSTDKGLVHVLGYQNDAKNLSDGANALILPFPSAEPMSEQNVIDLGETTGKHLLDHWASMVLSEGRMTKGIALNNSRGLDHDEVTIFQSGIYTIALSRSPSAIGDSMHRIPENKRPQVKAELLTWYEKTYPGWSLAVCCFDNKDKKKAEPLFWWYKPLKPEQLFFPAMDSHDGNPPHLNNNLGFDFRNSVWVDHIIMAGSDVFEATPEEKPEATEDLGAFSRYFRKEKTPRPIELWTGYLDKLPESSRQYLPMKIMGKEFNGSMRNGDFSIPVKELRKHDIGALKRVSP